MHDCQIDDIFIGDSEASLDTLKNIQAYQETKKMNIKCFLEKEYDYLYNQEIKVRKDQSEYLVRLLLPRKSDVEVFHNTVRHVEVL